MGKPIFFFFKFYWETITSVVYFVKYRLLATIIKTNLLNCANFPSTQILSPDNRVLLLTIAVFNISLSPEEGRRHWLLCIIAAIRGL